MKKVEFYGAATVGTQGQVAIPGLLRRELGIKSGNKVLFVKAQKDTAGCYLCLPAPALQGKLPMPVKLGANDGAGPDSPEVDAKAEFLAKTEFFGHLDLANRRRVARVAHQSMWPPGEVIIREGEPAHAMYIVVSGLTKRSRISADGKVQVLRVLGPGKVFNHLSLFDGDPVGATAETILSSTLYSVRYVDMLSLLSSALVCQSILHGIAKDMRYLVELAHDLSVRSVTVRLAKLLLDYEDVLDRLSRDEMAAMIGTVREVLARAVRKLQSEKAVVLEKGCIAITDKARLLEIASVSGEPLLH